MADPAKTENTTDTTTLLQRPRRSSILKTARPPLEDVDQNVTCEPGEKRRLSKRVSFSETHEIKLYNRDLSGEHGSSADNAFERAKLSTPGVKKVGVSKKAGVVVTQPHDQHDALEQSFFCSEDDGGHSVPICQSEKALVLMQDALSCLVFSGPSSVGVAGKNASSDCPNRTTLASETIELTCTSVSSVLTAQIAVDGNTASCLKTTLADKTMDLTCDSMSTGLHLIQNGSVDGNTFNGHLNKTTLDHKTLDLTCTTASSPALDQLTVDSASPADSSASVGLNKTMVVDKTMDLTCTTATSVGLNKTMLTDKTMDLTCATGSPMLDRMATDYASSIGRNPISGQLNKTMLIQENMDTTCPILPSAEQMPADSVAAHHAAPSSRDASMYLQETMNVTCASVADDLATDAATMAMDADVAGHAYETALGAAVGGACKTNIPSIVIAEDACSVSNPTQRLDLDAYVASMHRYDARDILGDDDSPARTASDTVTVGEAAGIENHVAQFNLASFMQGMRKNCADDIFGDDGDDEHIAMGPSVPVLGGAVHLNECCTSAEKAEAQETSSTIFPPVANMSLATDYVPVSMNTTGPDFSGRGALSRVGLLSGLHLSSTNQDRVSSKPGPTKGSEMTMQPNDAENTASHHMSLTCAFGGDLDNGSTALATPLLADGSKANREQPDGSTSHSSRVLGAVARNGDSFNLANTCLMSVAMDSTCTGMATSVVIERDAGNVSEQHAGQTSNSQGPVTKADEHLGKCGSLERAIDTGKSRDQDGAGDQCSGARGHNLSGSGESARVCVTTAAGSSDLTVRLMGAMSPCKFSIEPTLTSMPVLLPGSPLEKVCPVEPATRNIISPDVVPEESPLPVEATAPSFHEATPGHKATDGMRCVEARAVVTPIRPASSKMGERKAMSSLKKRLVTEVQGDGTLSGKDSIVLQQMVSPVSCARRMADAASSSKSKDFSPASKTDLSAMHRKFNAFLDSTGNGNITGLDVSALLATTIGDADSISGDVSFPQITQGVSSVHGNGHNTSKSASKRPGGTSHSRLAKSPGRKSSVNSGDKADVGKTASQVPAVKGEILAGSRPSKEGTGTKSGEFSASEVGLTSGIIDAICDAGSTGRVSASLEGACQPTCATAISAKRSMASTSGFDAQGDRSDSVANSEAVRKSATFVVSSEHGHKNAMFAMPSKDARPSATFAVLPSLHCDVYIDGSTTSEKRAEKAELLPAPADAPCASSASHKSSAMRRNAGVHRSTDKSSHDRSTATTRFRKKLQFTELHEQRRSVRTGTTSGGSKLDLSFDAGTVSLGSVLSESPGQFPVSSSSRSCSELHASSAGSSSKKRQQQWGSGHVGYDEEMLMDVPEPPLVTNSPTPFSLQAVQKDNGATLNQLTLQQGGVEATLVSGHISTSLFYSSGRKKRSKPPSTPSSKASESGRSTAKKHRSAKGSAKNRDLKSRHTPASSTRKRRASLETRSTDKYKCKAKDNRTETRGAENKSRAAGQEETVHKSNGNDSLLSIFVCNVKLRSLPPTPPGLFENIADARLAEQKPQDFAEVQSKEGGETRASPKPPDICEPVVFDTAEVDLTAGIDIDDILDRLDDANAQESVYWSFTELPEESLKAWWLRAIELMPDKAVFGFIKDRVKLTVSLGDFVRQSGSTDKGALVQRTAGAVPRRTKLISALSFEISCLPQAHFNQYILKERFLDTFKTDELLKRYPNTDCLGKMLAELGAFVVRYGPLSKDIGRATAYRPYSFNYPVLSIHIMAPRRLIWFYLDLPIDLDTYPHSEILPSSRPYSDEYKVITTEKLHRITAHVKPGPAYITRLVKEIEAFMEK